MDARLQAPLLDSPASVPTRAKSDQNLKTLRSWTAKTLPVPDAQNAEWENTAASRPTTKHRSKELWKKARGNVMHVVHIKQRMLGLQTLARNTQLMRAKTEKERNRYVLTIMIWIVILGAATAMSKSALFHTGGEGLWDKGHEYKFGYALSLTLLVFLLKVALVFVQFACPGHTEESDEESDDEAEGQSSPQHSLAKRVRDAVVPWALLVTFTFFEMMSATVASLGLLFGAPTSIFVIFKSSKTIFLAILSVLILRRKLNLAQWFALLLISVALATAAVAEGKGTKKGGGELNLLGPGLLLLSELFHAAMLVCQEISVRNYWSDPIALLSSSACIGVVLTIVTMWKANNIWVTLPDGGHRPASDFKDTLFMCWNSPALMIIMLTHLGAHVSSDVTHIVILKHISALARTLCDAFKLILMWFLGKAFWFFGILPVLAEAWHPGLIGSWLMLPAIMVIMYSMLMFRDGLFFPIKIKQGGIEEEKRVPDENNAPRIKVNLEDPFYMTMFRSKKLQPRNIARAKTRMEGNIVTSVTSDRL